jgi:hypothetical protein
VLVTPSADSSAPATTTAVSAPSPVAQLTVSASEPGAQPADFGELSRGALDLAFVDLATNASTSRVKAVDVSAAASARVAASRAAASDNLLVLKARRQDRIASQDQQDNARSCEHGGEEVGHVDDFFAKLGEKRMGRLRAGALLSHAV